MFKNGNKKLCLIAVIFTLVFLIKLKVGKEMLNPLFIDLVKNSNYLVALTGAGISTDSGLSDYRGPNGVWTRKDKGLEPLPSREITTVIPNKGHKALVSLFELGKLQFLISQNVDNLHLKSGIKPEKLVELHGNHNLFKCIACDSRFTAKELNWDKSIYGNGYRKDPPHLDQPMCYCGGRIISSIINFGDPMPKKELDLAFYHAKKTDVFLVIGSSLVVHPAASLPLECYNNGGSVIIINKGETALDDIALIKINDSAGTVLEELVKDLI